MGSWANSLGRLVLHSNFALESEFVETENMGRLLPLIALTCFMTYVYSQKLDALNFLKRYNAEAPQYSWAINEASWKHATNITQHNSDQYQGCRSGLQLVATVQTVVTDNDL